MVNSSRRHFLSICGGALAASALNTPPFAATERAQAEILAPVRAPQKVIIDTDPGVDDAYALLLAMRSPELQILAITAVAGNVPLNFTLPNALRMVEIADRSDIPVAGGASEPLIRRLITAEYAHGENGLGGVQFPYPKIQAVKEYGAELICRLVRENPHEITLIGIGPLTNIALALRQDPEIAKMIRGIVLMGGSLSGGNVTPAAEFNFYVDPEAASIVFNAGVPIRMVGLDVTRKVELTASRIAVLQSAGNRVSNAAARIAQATMDMYRRQGGRGGPHMHDPLAVSSLIRPDILIFEDYCVEIETSGDITAGESVGWKHGPLQYSAPLQATGEDDGRDARGFLANAKIATGVNAPAFFDLLLSRLTGG